MTGFFEHSKTRVGAALLGAAVLVAGCETVGDPLEAMGARVPAPDEFRVIARKPLQLPVSASLPEPQPGVPSPLEPNPSQDAIAALIGTDGTLPVAVPGGQQPSQSEELLLQAANAAASDREIRVQLEEDQIAAEEAKAEGPYEPPTLLELLTFSDEEQADPETLLEPVAESQRLQREGIAAPNDPSAAPPEEDGETAPEGAQQFPVAGTSDRPSQDPFAYIDREPEAAAE
ncbi:MAG: DUF3035 domain-containing protein [Pseudomonadota bacterium]